MLNTDFLFEPPCSWLGLHKISDFDLPTNPYFESNGSHTLLDIPSAFSSAAEPLEIHTFSSSPWFYPFLPEKSPMVCLLQLMAYLNDIFLPAKRIL